MLIDWFTVVAQAINFLVLVWLLKRFLYQPILDALDARERRISDALRDAEAQKAEAEKERHAFQQKNETFDQQRAELFRKALNEAQAEREGIISTARKDSQEIQARRVRAMNQEYQNLSERVAQQASAEVLAITRKVLSDLGGTTLEAHLVEVFIKRLHELSEPEKMRLASAIAEPGLGPSDITAAEKAGAGIIVRSAFELSPLQRKAIESALGEVLDKKPAVYYTAAPDLISGIELVIDGYKLAWSARDYLASLEREMAAAIKIYLYTEPAELELESENLTSGSSEGKQKARA